LTTGGDVDQQLGAMVSIPQLMGSNSSSTLELTEPTPVFTMSHVETFVSDIGVSAFESNYLFEDDIFADSHVSNGTDTGPDSDNVNEAEELSEEEKERKRKGENQDEGDIDLIDTTFFERDHVIESPSYTATAFRSPIDKALNKLLVFEG